MTATPHNGTVHFRLEVCPDVRAEDLESRRIAGGIEYPVVCTQCQGQFVVVDFSDTYRVGFFGHKKTPDRNPLPVACDCGMEHLGHPEGTLGCGAAWEIIFS